MAIAFNTANQLFSGSGTSTSVSLTVPSGGYLYAFVMMDNATPNITSIVWNTSEALSPLAGPITISSFRMYVYRLTNPTAATANLVGTWSSSTGGKYMSGVVYTGVNTSATPNTGSATAAASTTVTSSSVTIQNTGGWRVCCYLSDGGGVTSGSGNTLRGSVLNTAWGVFDTNGAVATGTMTESSGISANQAILVSEIPAPSTNNGVGFLNFF